MSRSLLMKAIQAAATALAVTTAAEASATPTTPMEFYLVQGCPISTRGAYGCMKIMLARGTIGMETAVDLNNAINAAPPDFKGLVILDSLGGSTYGGMRMGSVLRDKNMTTLLAHLVDPSGETIGTVCMSACAVAFLGGANRTTFQAPRLGVHQFYSGDGTMDVGDAQRILTDMGRYVDAMGVDRRLLDIASYTPPEKVHWLTLGEIKQYGVAEYLNDPKTGDELWMRVSIPLEAGVQP